MLCPLVPLLFQSDFVLNFSIRLSPLFPMAILLEVLSALTHTVINPMKNFLYECVSGSFTCFVNFRLYRGCL